MPLFQGTQRQYYDNSQTLVSTGAAALPALTFSPLPAIEADFDVFINGSEINSNLYSYNANNGVITMNSALAAGTSVLVQQITPNEQLGNYQYVAINDLIANFQVNYVGEDKIIRKVKVPEISFHIQRAIAELSYDTLKIMLVLKEYYTRQEKQVIQKLCYKTMLLIIYLMKTKHY